jgi:hypothetical protein
MLKMMKMMSIFEGELNSGLTIDVCLLAILIALHITKKDKDLEFLVLALLLVHVIVTTDSTCSSSENQNPVEREITLGVADENAHYGRKHVQDTPKIHETPEIVDSPNLSDEEKRKSVSNSTFERQFTIPKEYSKMSSILPNDSASANGKLAQARSNFFSNILGTDP